MKGQISAAEYRALMAKPHKYGAAAIVAHGYRFDSQAEAARYDQLLLLLRAGQITDLRVHPSYVLQEAFRDRAGVRVACVRYVADFAYIETVTNVTVVEDVKGARTAVYLLKAKLFKCRYPDLDYRVLKVGGRR